MLDMRIRFFHTFRYSSRVPIPQPLTLVRRKEGLNEACSTCGDAFRPRGSSRFIALVHGCNCRSCVWAFCFTLFPRSGDSVLHRGQGVEPWGMR